MKYSFSAMEESSTSKEAKSYNRVLENRVAYYMLQLCQFYRSKTGNTRWGTDNAWLKSTIYKCFPGGHDNRVKTWTPTTPIDRDLADIRETISRRLRYEDQNAWIEAVKKDTKIKIDIPMTPIKNSLSLTED